MTESHQETPGTSDISRRTVHDASRCIGVRTCGAISVKYSDVRQIVHTLHMKRRTDGRRRDSTYASALAVGVARVRCTPRLWPTGYGFEPILRRAWPRARGRGNTRSKRIRD